MPLPDALHRSFGRSLRDLRTDAGLSQEELAHASELTRNYVSELELGKKSPSLRTIARLAGVLGVRSYELVRAAEARAPRRGPEQRPASRQPRT